MSSFRFFLFVCISAILFAQVSAIHTLKNKINSLNENGNNDKIEADIVARQATFVAQPYQPPSVGLSQAQAQAAAAAAAAQTTPTPQTQTVPTSLSTSAATTTTPTTATTTPTVNVGGNAAAVAGGGPTVSAGALGAVIAGPAISSIIFGLATANITLNSTEGIVDTRARITKFWDNSTEIGVTAVPPSPPMVGASSNKCPGTCQDTRNSCAAGYLIGLCPGGNNIRCCPPRSAALGRCPPNSVCKSASRIQDPTALARKAAVSWADFTSEQQANILRITNEAKLQGITNVNSLAYILATANWESHLTPISEWGGKSKRYAPYYGRGFVQLTWRNNYEKFRVLLKSQRGWNNDIVAYPEGALAPDYAAFIMVYGMKNGIFTGRKLSSYFSTASPDFYNARRIVNGLDKARLIANLAQAWVTLSRNLLAMN